MTHPLQTRAPMRRTQRPTHGVTMVELMVGLVVGLLVSLAAVSSAQLFNAAQRQGVGAGSGSANAASVLASIKNDVANGGLGFFGNYNYVCTSLNFSINNNTISNGAAFAPVQALRVNGNDQLDVAYATDVTGGVAVQTFGTSNGSVVSVKTMLPVVAGQHVLLAPAGAGLPCTVRTVTAVAAPTASSRQQLTFANAAGATYNQVNFTTTPTYPENSLVSLIGAPQWNRYALNGTSLQMTRMTDNTTVTLLRNVIGFRVQYGTGSVATPAATGSRGSLLLPWVKTTDAGWGAITPANVGQVKAVRIGILVRSTQREKPDSSGNCQATTVDGAMPRLFGDTITPDVTDWKCYRYRSQIVVVPMRNIVYGL